MDLAKIKELKVMLDAKVLSQDQFSSLKTKIINGEDINLDNYNQEHNSSKLNTDSNITPDKINLLSKTSKDQQSIGTLDNYKRETKWQQY